MPDAQDPIRQISLFTNPALRANVTSLTTRLVSDLVFREAFIADPNTALRQAGIPVETPVRLTDRDRLLLQLIGDRSVETLYRTGDISALCNYITANYSGLAVSGLQRADVAADFDVLIEAEAVAVGVVAVAAAAVASAVEQVLQGQIESTAVLNARIAALESRLQLLENQIPTSTRVSIPS